MSLRAFLLSVLALAAFAPSANAGPIDRYVPVYDASTGITGGKAASGRIYLRFGPKAAKVYRGLAGQKVTIGCGHPVRDDGTTTSVAGGSTDGSSYSWSERAGMTWTDVRLPRRRGRVNLSFGGAADVCFISAKQPKKVDECVPGTSSDNLCVRVVVTLTEQGRTDLDERLRALELDAFFDHPLAELQAEFGDQVVALDSPDASAHSSSARAEVSAVRRSGAF